MQQLQHVAQTPAPAEFDENVDIIRTEELMAKLVKKEDKNDPKLEKHQKVKNDQKDPKISDFEQSLQKAIIAEKTTFESVMLQTSEINFNDLKSRIPSFKKDSATAARYGGDKDHVEEMMPPKEQILKSVENEVVLTLRAMKNSIEIQEKLGAKISES